MKRIAIALALTTLLLLTACGQVESMQEESESTPAQTVQEERQPAPQEEKKAQTQVTATGEPQPVTENEPTEQTEAVATTAQVTESETAVADEPTPQAPAQNEPVQNAPTEYPNVSPAPVQKAPVPVEPTPTIPAEPAPLTPTEPTPAPTAETYSVDEAMRLGNEYAQTQYGVAIDTSMTAADSGYYPGTVESASWLAANGGQSALNEAVCRNVDATFANLAARDGAATVSAYATFSCTVRYEVGDYAIVILYG